MSGVEGTPNLRERFPDLYDPITGELMYHAVILVKTGWSYNQSTADLLLSSPGSENLEIRGGLTYIPNTALRALIHSMFVESPPGGPSNGV